MKDQVMAAKRRPSFDPKAFLAKIGDGHGVGKYRKDQVIFSQGDPADAVFYVQQGKVEPPSYPSKAWKQLSAFSGQTASLARGALPDRRSAYRQSRPDDFVIRRLAAIGPNSGRIGAGKRHWRVSPCSQGTVCAPLLGRCHPRGTSIGFSLHRIPTFAT